MVITSYRKPSNAYRPNISNSLLMLSPGKYTNCRSMHTAAVSYSECWNTASNQPDQLFFKSFMGAHNISLATSMAITLRSMLSSTAANRIKTVSSLSSHRTSSTIPSTNLPVMWSRRASNSVMLSSERKLWTYSRRSMRKETIICNI